MTFQKYQRWVKTGSAIAVTVAVLLLTIVMSRILGKYQPFADLIQESQSGPFANLSIVVDNAVISHRLNRDQVLTIRAREVSLSRDRRLITATGIHDSAVTGRNGAKLVTFSAGTVTVLSNSGLLGGRFQGSVRIENGVEAASPKFPGPRISCSTLVWDSQSEYINCPGLLTISLPGYKTVLTGKDLAYDVKTGNLHVSHVHGVFRLPDAVQ